MADLIDRITNEVWSEVADSRDSKWTLRREHIENAVKKAIAALSPAPDAREAALHPDDMLPEAIRLIRQEASRDHSQDVVTGLKHIALLLEQLIGETRT